MSQLSLLGVPEAPPMERRSVVMSPSRLYRLRLTIAWDDGPPMLWCMRNPSTADEMVDDPTISRCKAFARRARCGRIEVVNLFAWRSPHPDDLGDVHDPIGPGNDEMIVHVARETHYEGGKLVAGWGLPCKADKPGGTWAGRDKMVLKILDLYGPVYCYGRSKSGTPTHPMARGRSRIPDDAPLVMFTEKAEGGAR